MGGGLGAGGSDVKQEPQVRRGGGIKGRGKGGIYVWDSGKTME